MQLGAVTASKAESVPFIQQDLSSGDEDEDEDYVYDEELNKTFNRTVEDISIDDISRHLETLEITQSEDMETPQEGSNRRHSQHRSHNVDQRQPRRLQSNGMYKIPSSTTTQHLKSGRNSNVHTYEDSDCLLYTSRCV